MCGVCVCVHCVHFDKCILEQLKQVLNGLNDFTTISGHTQRVSVTFDEHMINKRHSDTVMWKEEEEEDGEELLCHHYNKKWHSIRKTIYTFFLSFDKKIIR